MDGSRFDDLTRALARGASRRRVLKGMAGGLGALAAAVGLRPGDADAARLPNGSACSRATQCASFKCADGVCCDSQCTGQCEACDLQGSVGTCTPLPAGAQQWGDRPACTGTDVCQASCDGVERRFCTQYPGLDIPCKQGECENGWGITYGCGGDGTCHPLGESCGLYVCDAAGVACLTSCQTDRDCADEAFCDLATGTCREDRDLGEDCTLDTQCRSGICSNNTCCVERCATCEACNLPGNLGFCGPVADGGTCNADGGDTCCEGDCVDTDTDVEHCGQCDNGCIAIENGRAVCINGVCDIECLPGFQRCDFPALVCIPDGGCCGDSECAPGEFCDLAAGSGTLHTCRPDLPYGSPCARNCGPLVEPECSENNVCLSDVCLPNDTCGCAADTDCLSTEFCDFATNTCRPDFPYGGGPCDRAAQCETGICRTADSVCGCDGDDDCTALGQVCDETTAFCVECTEDANCDPAEFCDLAAQTCQPDLPYGGGPCDRAAQCATGVCRGDGLCGCDATADCPAGTVCNTTTQVCVECLVDTDCAANEYCDLAANTCQPDIPYGQPCVRDAQCVTGVCRTPGFCGCDDNGDCAAFGQVCNTATQVCVDCTTDPDCLETEYCDLPTQTCQPDLPYGGGPCDRAPQCATGVCRPDGLCGCDATADCPAGVCNTVTQFCVQCTVDTDCAANQYCDLVTQTCQPDLPYGGGPCDRPAQCATGVCRPDGFCGCDATADCPTDNYCNVATGICVLCNATTCQPAGQCFFATCDPVGTCIQNPRTGAFCENPDLCFSGGSCDNTGVCIGGTPAFCDICFNCNSADGTCDPVANGTNDGGACGTTCCNGECCADPAATCTGPGGACEPPSVCAPVGGACTVSSDCCNDDNGRECCGNICVNTNNDENHCGACNNGCVDPANGTVICQGGTCNVNCDTGFQECNGACVTGPCCTGCAIPGGSAPMFVDSSNPNWQSTGITMDAGECIQITTSGTYFSHCPGGCAGCTDQPKTPAGSNQSGICPLGYGCGSLIARVSTAPDGHFWVGPGATFKAPSTGTLELFISATTYFDNCGGYTASFTCPAP